MSAGTTLRPSDRASALLLARLLLGVLFFMSGVHKIFLIGLMAGAESMFIEPYVDTFLPVWALWATGVTVPFVELIAGFLVILGLWRKPAYLALAGVLVLVMFGHTLLNPFFPFHHDVFPRAALLIFLLSMGLENDTLSVDGYRRR
jgi:uncharacterized membrane protein YphA (DoxX/SURF4 family)